MDKQEEQQDDDEISFDFSKIKSFFKKKDKQETVKEVKAEKKEVEEKIEEHIQKEKDHIKTEQQDVHDLQEAKQAIKKETITEKNVEQEKEKLDKVKEKLEEEDEISFDFKKVKGFFKKLGKEEQEEKPEQDNLAKNKSQKFETAEKDDEEISFDFKKIGKFFKKEKTETSKEPSDDDINFNLASIKTSYKKHQAWLLPTLIILLAMLFAYNLRIIPQELPFTDRWAQDTVLNHFRGQVDNQFRQQYPNLPDTNRNALVETEFQKFLVENKQQVDQQIAATSNSFKDRYRDPEGRTYMPDIDPYYWMRYAQNILDNGYPGDEQREGKNYDNHMLAPVGRFIDASDSFHPYFLATFYRIASPFNNLPLKDVIVFYPIIISMLAVIPVFFIARRLAGNVGGFFAAMMIAINQAFLNRTIWGHADTDAWVVFFPVYITWLFLEAFEAKTLKRGLLYSSIAGLFVGFFAITWGGWWYIFDFILGAVAIYLLYYLITHYQDFKKGISFFIKQPSIKTTLVVTGIFILTSGIFVSLFASFSIFINAPLSPITFSTIKDPVLNTLWPNVLTTVAELNPGSTGAAINSVGGKFLFWLAVVGIALSLFIRDQHGKLNVRYAALLTLWFIGSIYATVKGIRFTLLLAPAFAIAFGIALGLGYNHITKWISKGLHINKLLVGIVIFALFLLTLNNPIQASKNTASNDLPIVNDAWYNSLTKINNEAAPDAIVNSWWDFGHHFKALTDRAVTFDGTTQDTPQAHWIGKSLLTNNEDQAIGILRMLDCGANNAFDVAFSHTENTHTALDMIYSIMEEDKAAAKTILQEKGLPEEKADELLQFSHCNPPENYYITSEDMISKAGVWSHFGSWNFERADIWFNLKNQPLEQASSYMQENFGYTEEQAENIYFEAQSITNPSEANSWVAPWPGYATGVEGCQKESETEILCPVPANQGTAMMSINTETFEGWINTNENNKVYPNVIAYPTETGFEIKTFNNNTIGFGLTLFPIGNGNYNRMLSSPELAGAMFTRLFFMEGHGLKHFEKFSDERTITGGRIIVWKVDWEGKQENVWPTFIPEPESVEEVIIEEEPVIEETIVEENTETENATEDNN